VHWREHHYAAVIAEQDGQYLVQDPTFLTAEWIDGATLEAEASGYFLIPAHRLMAGWRSVPAGEAAQVFGQGYPQAQCDAALRPTKATAAKIAKAGTTRAAEPMRSGWRPGRFRNPTST